MKLRFTPRAARDLAEIADYIREHSPQAALHVRAAILESLQSLVLFPHIGRQQKVEGVRKLVRGGIPIWSITPLTTRPRKLSFSPSSTQPASANIRIPNTQAANYAIVHPFCAPRASKATSAEPPRTPECSHRVQR